MKKNTPLYFITMLLPLLLVFSSCSENPTTAPDPISAIEISALHKTCTEVWINVKAESGSLPRGVKMFVDSVKYEFILTKSDTVLLYEGLKPGKEYGFEMVSNTTKSNKLSVRTLDTTSHAMQWEFLYLGDGYYSNSLVNDVAIINENDMWFVGEFYRGDSLFNVIHYNGGTVEYLRIYYEVGNIKSYGELRMIKAFEDGEIWFASGHIMKYKNGVVTPWTITDADFPTGFRKIIGTQKDFYAIGDKGTISHYENGKWTKIPTNTGLPIQDIHGAYNAKGEYEIYAVAGEKFASLEHRVYKIENDVTKQVYDGGIEYALDGVWFTPSGDYYVVGDGIYRKSITLDNETPWKNLAKNLTNYYSLAINGTDVNDFFVANAFDELLHFNGVQWYRYADAGFSWTFFKGIVIKDNLVVVYGNNIQNRCGSVIIGKRN